MRPTTINLTATGATTSAWVPVDIYNRGPSYGIRVTTTGVAATVQSTVDDVFDSTVTPTAFSTTATSLVGATSSTYATVNTPVRAFRLSVAGAGTFSMTIIEQSIV